MVSNYKYIVETIVFLIQYNDKKYRRVSMDGFQIAMVILRAELEEG